MPDEPDVRASVLAEAEAQGAGRPISAPANSEIVAGSMLVYRGLKAVSLALLDVADAIRETGD